MTFGYALELMYHAGVTPTKNGELPDGAVIADWCADFDYQEICTINDEARFSPRDADEQSLEKMRVFKDKVLNTCKSKWSIWQKLYYRLIHCLY